MSRTTLNKHLPPKTHDVFRVTQLTKGTPYEKRIGADLVFVPPHSVSEIHRHQYPYTILFGIKGFGTILVGRRKRRVILRRGERFCFGKAIFHGVCTGKEGFIFLSIQSPPIKFGNILDLEPLKPRKVQ